MRSQTVRWHCLPSDMKKELEADKETCFFVATDDKEDTQGIERITAGCKADLPAVGCDRPRFERGNRGSICGDDRIVKVQKNFRKL